MSKAGPQANLQAKHAYTSIQNRQQTDTVLVDVVKYMRRYHYIWQAQSKRPSCDMCETVSACLEEGIYSYAQQGEMRIAANAWIDAIKKGHEKKGNDRQMIKRKAREAK